MKCPHCLTGIHESLTTVGSANLPQLSRSDGTVLVPLRNIGAFHQVCPECTEIIVKLRITAGNTVVEEFIAFPRSTTRPIPPEVSDPYRCDFREAAVVLADSAKASATLSRRCLQMILRDCAKVKPSDLSKEIFGCKRPWPPPENRSRAGCRATSFRRFLESARIRFASRWLNGQPWRLPGAAWCGSWLHAGD
jgi:hypothetical protein